MQCKDLWYISHGVIHLEAQVKVNELKKDIEVANQPHGQVGLAKMQTQFAVLPTLDPEFQIICSALVVFANTGAYICHLLALSIISSSEKVHMDGPFIS